MNNNSLTLKRLSGFQTKTESMWIKDKLQDSMVFTETTCSKHLGRVNMNKSRLLANSNDIFSYSFG